MNKVKIWTVAVIAALGLTACSNEDNSYRERYFTFEETVSLASTAGKYTISLQNAKGTADEISEVSDTWATVAPVATDGSEKTKIEVTVEENTTGAPRQATVTVKTNPNTVVLTINQGITNVNDPNEEETDQPAFTAAK